MKIEIWSDFTCPYCYLGKRRLEIALENTGCREVTEIEYKSFELDPDVTCQSQTTKYEMLMDKFQLSKEKVEEVTNHLAKEASAVGLDIKLDNVYHTNTFQAHRLAKFIHKKNQSKQAVEQLFKTYFKDHKNIGERKVLIELALELGIEQDEVEELLCLNKFSKKVKEDIELASELGVTDIPFYIFDETYAVQGVQTVESFEAILAELCMVKEEEEKLKSKPKTSYCEGNRCTNK